MPEEINRLVADHCSDRLYAPTPQSMANLESESLSNRAILSGDVMLDAVRHNISLAGRNSRALEELGLEPGRFGLVTVHRPSNTTGEALGRLLEALEVTANGYLPLVFPAHPRTRAMLDKLGYTPPPSLKITSPLTYLDNLRVMQAAALVITDSGGVQKEAAFLGTPCLTTRDETEWTETVEIGVNRLVGNAGRDLVAAVEAVLGAGDPFNDAARQAIEEHYGRGDAATKIVTDCIAWIREAA
jgi:UDP-N-acetylglucosamine 2-epimerase